MRFLDFLFSLIYVHICLHDEPKVPFEYECKQLVLHRLWLKRVQSHKLWVQTNLQTKICLFFFFTWCSVLIIKSTKPSSFDFIFNVCERQRWSAIRPSCTYRWPRHPGVTSAWAKLEKFYFYTNDLYLFKKKNHSILNISFYYLTVHEVIYLSEYSF